MSSPAFDVIVCGSLHLDIMVYSPSLPRPDETVAGTKWAQQCGGKGGNQAVMAARSGARVVMIGRVGADDFGARLLKNLVDAEVDSSAVLVDETVGSGMSAAIVRDDGDYGAVIVSGANLRLEPQAVAQQWRAVGGARVLVLQNEIPEPANLAAASAAHADGAFVIMNAAPARVMAKELLDRIDCLVVNRIEAEMLSGDPVRNPTDAASVLSKIGVRIRNVIVTLGGEGLVLKSADGSISTISAKKVEVISSHGAGDCFVGALAAKVAAGAALAEAAEFANAAAAAHVAGQK
jgi:ribokinase